MPTGIFVRTPEHKAKLSKIFSGYKFPPRSPEHCANLSQVLKGRHLSEEHRINVSKGGMGRIVSQKTRAKISAAQKGRPLPLDHRAKLSAVWRAHRKTEGCHCILCCPPQSPTTIENFLVDIILGEFPRVVRECPFGHYRVDAYLPPPYHLAFEADGEYWHRGSEEQDQERDSYLFRIFGLPVIRIGESEIRELAARV